MSQHYLQKEQKFLFKEVVNIRRVTRLRSKTTIMSVSSVAYSIFKLICTAAARMVAEVPRSLLLYRF